MKNINNIQSMFLAAILSASVAHVQAENNFEVKNIGELKSIASAQLNGKIPFNSLLQQQPL